MHAPPNSPQHVEVREYREEEEEEEEVIAGRSPFICDHQPGASAYISLPKPMQPFIYVHMSLYESIFSSVCIGPKAIT